MIWGKQIFLKMHDVHCYFHRIQLLPSRNRAWLLKRFLTIILVIANIHAERVLAGFVIYT